MKDQISFYWTLSIMNSPNFRWILASTWKKKMALLANFCSGEHLINSCRHARPLYKTLTTTTTFFNINFKESLNFLSTIHILLYICISYWCRNTTRILQNYCKLLFCFLFKFIISYCVPETDVTGTSVWLE